MSAPNPIVYLNGDFLPRHEAKLSVDERGFFFGDGVYEVTRYVEGRPQFLEGHMRRLQRGLSALKLAPQQSLPEIEAISQKLIGENGLSEGEATVYVQITRGACPRAHHFPGKDVCCTVFISASGFDPKPLQEKRAVGVSLVTTLDIRWARCDLKTVNLLPNVLAKQQAQEAGAYEALFVREGVLMEGSLSNAFFVKADVLRTHPLSNRILGGITREMVLELAQELVIKVDETPVLQSEIPSLQECFMSGTTTDIMPVVKIDQQVVGNGKPGPVAAKLYEALERRLYGGKKTSAAA